MKSWIEMQKNSAPNSYSPLWKSILANQCNGMEMHFVFQFCLFLTCCQGFERFANSSGVTDSIPLASYSPPNLTQQPISPITKNTEWMLMMNDNDWIWDLDIPVWGGSCVSQMHGYGILSTGCMYAFMYHIYIYFYIFTALLVGQLKGFV